MQPVKENQLGVMFWAGRDTLDSIHSMGVTCGQLGVGGDADLSPESAGRWKADLEKFGIAAVTVVCAYDGESYADIPTVQKTVGFIPPETREAREARTIAASHFAAELGVPGIGCHIGFVPEDHTHPDYIAVRDMVRRICDHAARHGQTFALETGQEPAEVLLRFLLDVDRPNLGINFDPANMILYGTGDPIMALGILGPKILSVHCKDGDWPLESAPGSLGKERPLGQGSVGIPVFLRKLREVGYRGTIHVERECEDQRERLHDINVALTYLRDLGV